MKSVSGWLYKCFFKPFLLFTFILLVSAAQGQKRDINSKLSPTLDQKMHSVQPEDTGLFRVMIKGGLPPGKNRLEKFHTYKIADYDSVSFLMIRATFKQLRDSILQLPEVLFVEDGRRVAKEELMVNNFDLSTNKINVVHAGLPQLNGDGFNVSIKENKPDTTDIDFGSRYVPASLASHIISSHASIMATMIAGGGNSWYQGKGVAWAGTISSSDYANLLPDPNASFQQNNISVQNHSYGVGIENFYGADAAAYDASVISNPSLLHIFSSGNVGASASTTGMYAGIEGFANLTGSFKMAKNIITAGATDSFSHVAALSSKGPAYDGRVRPEIVAFGIDGSSGAAALVSGVSLLLQQQYKQLHGTLPPNALIKAVLLNSADDAGNKEVDYSNGFGSLNAFNAVKAIAAGRFMNGTVANGETKSFSLSIPEGVKKLKVTLVWNDPPATVNAAKALVNDLDLELINTSTNENWFPWVLNKFPDADSLNQLATRERDSLNNIEQVTIDAPMAGNYQLNVKGYALNTASQDFYITYQFDSIDIFEWNFPTAPDPVFSSSTNTLRWTSSFAATTGKLDYSSDNGASWQLIDPAVNLTIDHYTWNTPGIISSAILKMTIGSNEFTSDEFIISSRTQTGVGFNCPDSFLFYWNKLPGVNEYRLYTMGSRYMEPVLNTTDSFEVLHKVSNPSLYYAVAPIIDGKEGVRSYTINYMIQGVDCYIRSFLVSLTNNAVEMELSLGSLYNVTKIVLEKWDGRGFQPLQQLLNNNNLLINFTDNNLTKGLNIYRVRLDLAGGSVVYSLEEDVFYFGGSLYVVYPNPAPQYQDIHIAQQDVDLAFMQVFNAAGIKVFEKDLDDRINTIPAGTLSKGFYFIRIIKDNKQQQMLKLVVY